MSTFLRNKTISKTTPLRKENPFPQFNVASHKRPGIGLSFEYTTTLLSGEGEEGRTGTTTMFKKRLSKYTIFSTVLSKIVAFISTSKSKSMLLSTYSWPSDSFNSFYQKHMLLNLYLIIEIKLNVNLKITFLVQWNMLVWRGE